jgi:hypothetical protein
MNFTEFILDDDNTFKATISCNGFSAESVVFSLGNSKKKEDEKNIEKCLCKKTSWTADDLKYIVTQLRKKDGLMMQRDFDEKGNPYFLDEKGNKVESNDRGKAPKEGYKYYYKETSFYDRPDDVDKKPLKDRIFFMIRMKLIQKLISI